MTVFTLGSDAAGNASLGRITHQAPSRGACPASPPALQPRRPAWPTRLTVKTPVIWRILPQNEPTKSMQSAASPAVRARCSLPPSPPPRLAPVTVTSGPHTAAHPYPRPLFWKNEANAAQDPQLSGCAGCAPPLTHRPSVRRRAQLPPAGHHPRALLREIEPVAIIPSPLHRPGSSTPPDCRSAVGAWRRP